MSDKKGFTLTEIITVLTIIGILAVMAITSYNTMMMQATTRAAQNNLIAIYNAEQNYYLMNKNYCMGTAANCGSLASINTKLSLNITDNQFTYICYINAPGYACVATSNSDPNLTLTVTGGPPDYPQIILTGGIGCTTYTGASCNPNCMTDVSSYCP